MATRTGNWEAQTLKFLWKFSPSSHGERSVMSKTRHFSSETVSHNPGYIEIETRYTKKNFQSINNKEINFDVFLWYICILLLIKDNTYILMRYIWLFIENSNPDWLFDTAVTQQRQCFSESVFSSQLPMLRRPSH